MFGHSPWLVPPHTHKTESPLRQTHYYCTVQHHVPIDPYAERMPRADCSSNTSRNTPHSQPRALRHTLLTNIMSLWIRAPRN